MSDRPLKLFLVDQDPIFRLGLRVALEQVPNVQVVSEAETDTAALQILAELAQKDPLQVNLVVLELGNGRSSSQQLGLQFCRQLKAQYPNLPVLLLSWVQEPGLLLAARAAGVDGYCPKGTPVSQLVAAMQEVVGGGVYWDGEEERGTGATGVGNVIEKISVSSTTHNSKNSAKNFFRPFARLRYNLRLSGIDYINAALAQVTAKLQVPGLPILDKAVLAGTRRELLAARWLVNGLLGSAPPQKLETRNSASLENLSLDSGIIKLDLPKTENSPSLLSPRSLQATLFASCINKLQFSLENLTDFPLEIDILREDKKRELLYLILQKLANSLDELRASQIEIYQLNELMFTILCDLWQASITDFFGKFSRVKVGNQNLEIVNFLLQDTVIVQTEILNKIPLVVELFAYLLFQTELQIDNTSYPAGSAEANEQASMVLENLMIQVANGVVQPLLNKLSNLEAIKQNFYNRQLISTREIERFRNELSWRYRWNNYVSEAQAIFESRYELFVFAPRGIAKTSIYAPRSQELARLSGIPLVVTLTLEFRDAIAPRLKSLLSLLGSGVVFVLTQVIGRGLGLIGRGILQGIGNVSLPDKNLKRNGWEGGRGRGGDGGTGVGDGCGTTGVGRQARQGGQGGTGVGDR